MNNNFLVTLKTSFQNFIINLKFKTLQFTFRELACSVHCSYFSLVSLSSSYVLGSRNFKTRLIDMRCKIWELKKEPGYFLSQISLSNPDDERGYGYYYWIQIVVLNISFIRKIGQKLVRGISNLHTRC